MLSPIKTDRSRSRSYRVKSSRIFGRREERRRLPRCGIDWHSVDECNRSHHCLGVIIELADQEPCFALLHISLAPLTFGLTPIHTRHLSTLTLLPHFRRPAMPFNLPSIPARDNAQQDGVNAPAWLNMAVGCFDKICACSSSYSQDQVENEILDDECTLRNEAYWRTVEQALSAQDSEDGDDANNSYTAKSNDRSPERRTTRISVDAFITSPTNIDDDQAPLELRDMPSKSPCPSDSASPGTNLIEPLVLSPRSTTPPITCGRQQFVMDMSSDFKSRNVKNRRMKKCRSIFLRTSRALDYHSLDSVESFERRSKLLVETDETSLASMSTAPTEFSNSQRSGNAMDVSRTSAGSVVRRNDNRTHVTRLEAKLRGDSKIQTKRRPSARKLMDESVHSMPYLTMSQGYEV